MSSGLDVAWAIKDGSEAWLYDMVVSPVCSVEGGTDIWNV